MTINLVGYRSLVKNEVFSTFSGKDDEHRIINSVVFLQRYSQPNKADVENYLIKKARKLSGIEEKHIGKDVFSSNYSDLEKFMLKLPKKIRADIGSGLGKSRKVISTYNQANINREILNVKTGLLSEKLVQIGLKKKKSAGWYIKAFDDLLSVEMGFNILNIFEIPYQEGETEELFDDILNLFEKNYGPEVKEHYEGIFKPVARALLTWENYQQLKEDSSLARSLDELALPIVQKIGRALERMQEEQRITYLFNQQNILQQAFGSKPYSGVLN